MNNKYYLLALNRMPKVGPRTVVKLLRRWPNLEEMFSLSKDLLEKAGIPSSLAHEIKAFNFKEVEQDLYWQEAPNHFLLTLTDPNYPSLLKEISDPPFVLLAIYLHYYSLELQ